MSRSTSPGFPQSDNACPSWFWRPRSADILIATAKIHNTRRVRCAVSVCVVVLSVRDPPQRCQLAPSRHPSVELCTSDSKTPSTPCGCPRILRQKVRNGDPITWHRTVTRRSPAQEPAPHEHQHRRQKQTQRGSAATISERPIRSSRPAWSCATLGKAGSGRVALQCTTVRWLSTVCGQTTRRAKLARDGGASERCSARAHGRQCPAPHTAP